MMKTWLRNWNGAHTWATFLTCAGIVDAYLASAQGAPLALAMHISAPIVALSGLLIAACAKSLNAPRPVATFPMITTPEIKQGDGS